MTKKLYSVLGNGQRLDGGAMFGNAPRALWSRWMAPDDRNRIDLACRCLLIKEDDRTILLESGIGYYLPPKLRDRFGVSGDSHALLDNLHKLGVTPGDIDVVVLSHLHFDHAGGLLPAYSENWKPELVFADASYVVGRQAWERATEPHFRDRASFIPELQPLLEDTGRLHLVDSENDDVLGPDYRFHFSNGHTPGMMLTEIATERGPLVFVADLIPGTPWVHLPITMGYDRFPERLIDEKQTLLTDLQGRKGRLFLTHDPEHAVCSIAKDERGRFQAEHCVGSLPDASA